MFRVLTYLLIVVMVLLVNGCQTNNIDWQERLADSVDPINSLQAQAISTVYTRAYWQQQKHAKTEIWKYAFHFCETHPEYPNCLTVSAVLTNSKPAAN